MMQATTMTVSPWKWRDHHPGGRRASWIAKCAAAIPFFAVPASDSAAFARELAIEQVTILPMTADGAPVTNGTVVIRDGRIVAAGPSDKVRVPRGIRSINARGKYIMPALADMHVHIENWTLLSNYLGTALPPGSLLSEDIMLPYVAQGVLQVFNLSSDAETREQSAAVERGTLLGPHIALAVMVDGDPPSNPAMARVAARPEAGRAIVRDIADGDYDAVKTYSSLDFDTFSAIVDEAAKHRLRVLGHIPLREANRTEDLLLPHFAMVAHAEEFAYQTPTVSEADIPRFAALAKARGIWQITTLKLNERVVEMTEEAPAVRARPELKYVHPFTRALWFNNNRYARSAQFLPRRKKVVQFNPKLLRAFAEAGVPLVVGTDTLVSGIAAGFGLHDELEALAKAGIPNDLILAGATRIPAEWLGTIQDRGTLEAGKRADLLLLDADPRADVANTRAIAAVIVGGRYLSRAKLDTMMDNLAARYTKIEVPAQTKPALGGHLDFLDDHSDR